jgi:hypothetical protein
MTFRLENVPDEPPKEVEKVVDLDTGEIEKLNELPVMYKAQRLFSMPAEEDDARYRSPDYVEQYTEISTEIMSFMRDKESSRRIAYRRLVDTTTGEVFKSTQVIEYCDFSTAVPTVITCDRYPDGEAPADVIKNVEDFLDDQYKRIAGEI